MEGVMGNKMREGFGYTLSGFSMKSMSLAALRKADVRPGDYVIIRTRNSVYVLRATDDGRFIVSGGWFDRKGKSGSRTGVTGCSLGGSIIKIDIIAAHGLCIEFTNRLITSPVKSFVVFPRGWEN
jgi:hypothetical protein